MALRKEDMYYNDDQEARTTKRSRITIDVSPELRRRIKIAATQRVLQVRERIMQESGGQLFEDSAERVRQMRDERTKYLEELREQP